MAMKVKKNTKFQLIIFKIMPVSQKTLGHMVLIHVKL